MKRIYKITNRANNKVYVGQTKQTLKRRLWQHFKFHVNPHFGYAIEKYGKDNFVIELIEDNVSLNEIDEREKFWINYYKSFNPDFGYNKTEGGIAYKGQPMTQEHKDKLSKARKRASGVEQLDENFNVIKRWKTVSAAANYFKTHQGNITAACQLRQLETQGYPWKYINESLEDWKQRRETLIATRKTACENKIRTKRIAGYSIIQKDLETGQIIKTWNSIKEITSFYKCSISAINACLKNKQVSSQGFNWEYGEKLII